MRSLKVLGIVLLSIIIASNGYSQKKWTLQECIEYAIENNIQIKRQALQTQIARNNYNQSKFELLPSVDGSADVNKRFFNTIDSATGDFKSDNSFGSSLGLNARVNLFDGFKSINNIKAQNLNLMANMANLEKAKNDLALNIAATYLQVLYNKELYDVAKNQLDVIKLQVDKTKQLYEVGNIARGSVLEIEAQAANEKVNITNAQNSLNLSLLSLAQLLDLDTVNNFQVAEPGDLQVINIVMPNSVDTVYSVAEGLMPQIKSAEYGKQYSEKQLAIARGTFYPTLSATAFYGSSYDDPSSWKIFNKDGFSDQLKGNSSLSVGLTLSVPLFNKFANRTRVSNAKVEYLDAQYNLRLQKQILYKDIEQAYADAKAAYDNYKARNEAVISSEEAFKYVQQKFDVGLVNSVDYNVSKNNFIKAKSDLLQAKYQFIFKNKILDFYLGNPIKL